MPLTNVLERKKDSSSSDSAYARSIVPTTSEASFFIFDFLLFLIVVELIYPICPSSDFEVVLDFEILDGGTDSPKPNTYSGGRANVYVLIVNFFAVF